MKKRTEVIRNFLKDREKCTGIVDTDLKKENESHENVNTARFLQKKEKEGFDR